MLKLTYPSASTICTRPIASATAFALTGLMFAASMDAVAQSIPLANPSFESPTLTLDPTQPPGPGNGVAVQITDWVKEGPASELFGGLQIGTGVFLNVPVPPTPAVGNATGANIAFIAVDAAADGINEERNAISQQVDTSFMLEQDYAFTIGIGPSVTSPPALDATLQLSIGFFDELNEEYVVVGSRIIPATTLKDPADPDLLNDPGFPLLTDFTVVADDTVIGGVWAGGTTPVGRDIIVKVTQIGGDAGNFILDNAALDAFVPGDVDGDGDVDDADLGTMFSRYTGAVGLEGQRAYPDGDTDGDSDVDDADVGSAFAEYTGALGPTSVPEPASFALVGMGMALGMRRRR